MESNRSDLTINNSMQKPSQSILGIFLKPCFVVALLMLSSCGDSDDHNEATDSGNGAIADESITASTEVDSQPTSPPAPVVATREPKADTVPFSKVETHMILGTGSVRGAYFPIGGVICRLLNRHKAEHKLRCSVESTAGSIYNLRELREGNFDLVVSQSDWQYHAYNGTSTFEKEGPNPDLRAVFALEADPITLIVRADGDINTFEDLRNRAVSFGYTRSLQHRIISDLLDVMGWNDDSFKAIVRMSDPNQISGLCAGEVDATLFLMSSLDDYLVDHDESCLLKMIPLEGEHVKQVIVDKPYYRTGIIPAGRYLDSSEDVQSFGLGAVFIASESTSVKAIYNVVKEVVENIKDFKSLHPSLATIELNEMPYAGVSTPLHPGAIRYYQEARLLR